MYALGYVGPPSPVNMVKLVDVPEMDYYAKNQQGEASNYVIVDGNELMQ